jgi:hypothetical protein
VIEHADFGKEVVRYNARANICGFVLGKVFNMGQATNTDVTIDRDSLTMHTFITGSTGSGKSNTVYEMLYQLRKVYNIPFLIIESAKGEYKNIFGQFSDVAVYGTNPKKTALLKINPFRFPSDIHILEHLDRLVEIFNVCWPMYAAMPAILKEAMEKAYSAAGWVLDVSENPKGEVYPNFADLLEQIETVINESKYSADSKGDYSGALLTRVRSLTTGLNQLLFCKDDISDAALFDKNVIVDLSRVGSTETKSFIMGLLVMKLNEYRMTCGKTNSPLTHITVLEEAHNLLKRTSTEQLSESSNLLGKSVELLANSIAEMRTYGEGFIIADQSPGLLDMSVIRNTNTKIILRLPEYSDRELVGRAASLSDEQIIELSKLERGVAAVYQNDWIEPLLVKIPRSGLKERPYAPLPNSVTDTAEAKQILVNFLIQGRINKKLEWDPIKIEQALPHMNISARNKIIIKDLLAEYRKNVELSVWSDENFEKLARVVTDILGTRNTVQNEVIAANSDSELSSRLKDIVRRVYPSADDNILLATSQCFLRDFAAQRDEHERREKIYRNWFESNETNK